jgi:hypothetical protein
MQQRVFLADARITFLIDKDAVNHNNFLVASFAMKLRTSDGKAIKSPAIGA